MSQEIQLAFECPHLTIEERVALESDRRTLRTTQPVAPSALVKVIANKSVEIPPQGLYRAASLTAFRQGPYKTDSCNRDFVVSSPAGTFTFTLPLGVGITVTKVISEFQPQVTDLLFENSNGALQITDLSNTNSADSFITVSGKGADVLGFVQKQDIAQLVYPAYGFVKQDGKTRIQFAKPLKGNPDLFATYSVSATQCLRCQATRVENDYRFDSVGDVLLIQNENLLQQAALKILLTQLGSNPYHPWYGTSIFQRIGSKAVQAVASAISAETQRVLSKLQDLQRAQAKFQKVTPEEKIYSIDQINARPYEYDPTVYLLDVTVRNASNKPVSITVAFTVPSVVGTLVQNNAIIQTIG